MRVRLTMDPPVASRFNAKKGKEYEVFEKRKLSYGGHSYALKDERGEIFCIFPREYEVIEDETKEEN